MPSDEDEKSYFMKILEMVENEGQPGNLMNNFHINFSDVWLKQVLLETKAFYINYNLGHYNILVAATLCLLETDEDF